MANNENCLFFSINIYQKFYLHFATSYLPIALVSTRVARCKVKHDFGNNFIDLSYDDVNWYKTLR